MTFVNYLIPWVLNITGYLEQWDFAQEELTSELYKNFFTSSLNIIFFMVLNVQYLQSKGEYEVDE